MATFALGATLLAACGEPDAEYDTATSSPSPKPAALVDTCPKIESGRPDLRAEAEEWQAYADKLQDLRNDGDAETKTALDSLIPPVINLAEDPPAGQPTVEARRALVDGLTAVADQCKAAGSTALQ